MEARRIELEVYYNGTRKLAPYITDCTYTDNSDKTDDISITLADREGKWTKEWFPESGDTLSVKVLAKDWKKQGDNRTIDLGVFEVDQVIFSESVTINGVSVPITSTIRTEKKDKAWEKINLKSIASGIAKKAKLKLVYESQYVPYYKRKDQDDESDLEFLEGLCKEDGMCVKITNKQLIIFDEYKYDMAETKIDIVKGKSNIESYSFTRNAKNIYKACEIKFHNSKKDKTYRAYYEAKDITAQKNVLRLKEDTSEAFDEKTLVRKAKAKLREKNKNEWKASFSLFGDFIYFTGSNVNIKGFNKFDGKYNIESATYNFCGGFTTDLELRRCLEY